MRKTTLRHTLMATIVAAFTLATSAAFAVPTRAPLSTTPQSRATTMSIERYDAPVTLVRERTAAKTRVTFSAEPQLIDPNAYAVLEARSVGDDGSIVRWRCIATHDVAECLGRPLTLRYLPDDTRIELTLTLRPRGTAPNPIAVASK